MACLCIPLIPMPIFKDRVTGRRIYWVTTIVGAIFASLIVYPKWAEGMVIAIGVIGAMSLNAYFNSSHIKINGKIYAYATADRQPDPGDEDHDEVPEPAGYGISTDARFWWLLVPIELLCAANAGLYLTGTGSSGVAIIAAAVLVLSALGVGYIDANAGHTIARSQHTQFAIVSVVTLGAFPLIYLLAYYLTRCAADR